VTDMIVYHDVIWLWSPNEYKSNDRDDLCVLMDYTQINIAFRHLGIIQEIAECHGLLCGLICTQEILNQETWLDHLFEEGTGHPSSSAHAPSGDTTQAEWSVLHQLYKDTVIQIKDPEFSFRMLLPNDEQILAIRTQALADWCKGFLYGLGVGGMDSSRHTPQNVQEIVRDLIEISRVYHDDEEEEDLEMDEASYLELSEYVRVGVMLIYEELQAERDQQAGHKVLH